MKTTKTPIIISIIAIVLIIVAYAGYVIYRPLHPALGPASDDISNLIEEYEQSQARGNSESSPGPTANKTEFPLNIPEGTTLSIFANNLKDARFMAFDSEGVLYLSLTKSNKVVALPDEDQDGKADRVIEIITDIDRPHGLAFTYIEDKPDLPVAQGIKKDFQIALLPEPGSLPSLETKEVEVMATELKEYLYIAETGRVIRMEKTGKFDFGEPEIIVNDLPVGGNHFTRSLAISGEKLYISTGSSCNVCAEEEKHRATVWQYDLDGSHGVLFASGLRNSVGIEFNPRSGQLWGTENGRDLLGDDIPPDEINIIDGPSAGSGQNPEDFGWPICYGKSVNDRDYDNNKYIRDPCEDSVDAHIELPAHVAPLGFDFYRGSMFPELQDDMLVALHGSWNSSVPVGYKVIRVDLEGDQLVKIEDFISGWLVEGTTAGKTTYSSLGRPVDVITGPGGEIYISDDKAGVVYRLIKS